MNWWMEEEEDVTIVDAQSRFQNPSEGQGH